MKEHPIILFDGVCNFCNAGINYIIKQDKKKTFNYSTLQSQSGQVILRKYHLPSKLFDSFVLLENEKVYTKSTAALKVYSLLPWYWKWTQIFWIIPRFFRDAVYDLVARNRYKWFGKKEKCMVPTPELKDRFLD